MQIEIVEASPNDSLTFAQVPVGSLYMRKRHTFLKLNERDALCFNCRRINFEAIAHPLAALPDRHLFPAGTKITLTV